MIRLLFALLAVIVVGVGTVFHLGTREDPGPPAAPVADAAGQIDRGRYLAIAGNCIACHTVRGGAPFAGGRPILTPFGTIYGSNITPDKETGIGNWTPDDFWRAIHNGKSKDGTLLYPAFPYPNFTEVTREDADAMFAYLRSLEPVRQANREPELRFPFNNRILLAGWRALYFRPGVYQAEPERGVEWNRGAYLVRGLGHCSACHTARNVLGAPAREGNLAGAMIPMLNWYAPSLTSDAGAGLGDWERQHIADLLQAGVSQRGVVSGPMSEVTGRSLQHLTNSDIQAMAVYLKSVPQARSNPAVPAEPLTGSQQQVLKAGAAIYEKHCVDCHKAGGEGVPPHYPALANNRGVVGPVVNPVRITLYGGYPPSTAGNPRPYGMPPFSILLSDDEVAAVLSYIRNSWGNRASLLSAEEVNRYRVVPLD